MILLMMIMVMSGGRKLLSLRAEKKSLLLSVTQAIVLAYTSQHHAHQEVVLICQVIEFSIRGFKESVWRETVD